MKNRMEKYAELVVTEGVNLQKGELLAVSSPVECAELAEKIVESAYLHGARKVLVLWSNAKIDKLDYTYQSDEVISTYPDYAVKMRDYIMEEKGCYICIIAEDPNIFSNVNPDKLSLSMRTKSKALSRFRESTSSNKTRWSLIAHPNLNWAKTMFPDLDENAAYEKLWDYILKTTLLDKPDYLAAWRAHQADIMRRCDFLNSQNIEGFVYKNSIGTDFYVGMTDHYLFCGGAEKGADGIPFSANIPTEEVYSSPDCTKAEGTLVSAMPLIYHGATVDKFKLVFKNGKIVDYSAEVGYNTLKNIIETDEGSHRLGEIALVAFDSPIQNLKTLFFNTLFDENASCHFALGDCYPPCYLNGENLSEEEQSKRGLNHSLLHVDFMIGTSDLTVTAIKKNGDKIKIFENGNWTF